MQPSQISLVKLQLKSYRVELMRTWLNPRLNFNGATHDHCNSSVYSFRVEVTRDNLRYTQDIEFLNYIH